ncbi:alkaline phosphatase family protein [Paenibacillus motobuensis]|uniref:alkaline phosphatase family protein n=1 Tax=Paenibacillus TaxID=44249 RepID=UPI00203BF604|nr:MULTISPECIES: alkaline phosphatase family protein [Paenibacillus]MCM3038489.1 alkaline phosphatase family protein [Paenibacillus lutimineralis]MCM3645593.1 alkaline phosphatase family protein [Paenibacillus motobuensis]
MLQGEAKLIVVVLDGLRYDAARKHLGYMEHLVEQGEVNCYRVQSQLPSLSRPLYEVLLTGTHVARNGITANHIVRLSREQSVFHLAREAGLRTAAAAYHWVSELYNSAPFNPVADRHQHDDSRPIQHGVFYFEDHYPDSHLFIDAEHLRSAYDPHFLYIHSMNIDDMGHKYGGESKEYAASVRVADGILATLVPVWRSQGYHVVVTSDHGMNAMGHHGGTEPEERNVPLYVFGELPSPSLMPDQTLAISQLHLAPLMCHYLGIKTSEAMLAWD